MKAAPNATVVSGVLRSCRVADDGVGGEIEIEVAANETADPRADFIRPAPGQPLRAFYGELGERHRAMAWVGRRVRAQLTLLGGPGGSRVVVRKLQAR